MIGSMTFGVKKINFDFVLWDNHAASSLLHTFKIHCTIFTFSAHTTDIYTNSCTALFRCQTNCLVYLAIFLLIKQHIFWLVAKLKKKTRNFSCFFLLLISIHMISISRYHNGNNEGMCNISSHTLRKFSPQLVVEWIPPSSSNWPPLPY